MYLSSWFLLVACFGALFVVTGRRFAEYRALDDRRGDHRKTLDDYSEPMLRSMLTSSSTVDHCVLPLGVRRTGIAQCLRS